MSHFIRIGGDIMDNRELIKTLLDKDLDKEVAIVIKTEDGCFAVPIGRIYSSDDICIEVTCK